MSFNKRYIHLEKVLEIYTEDGIDEVIKYFMKPDAVFFDNNVCSILYDMINNNEFELAEGLILKHINNS